MPKRGFLTIVIRRNIVDHQYNKKYVVSNVVITYHSTIPYQDHVLCLDGGRHLFLFPKTHTVYQNDMIAQDPSLIYLCLNEDSVSGRLFNGFACIENNYSMEKVEYVSRGCFSHISR